MSYSPNVTRGTQSEAQNRTANSVTLVVGHPAEDYGEGCPLAETRSAREVIVTLAR